MDFDNPVFVAEGWTWMSSTDVPSTVDEFISDYNNNGGMEIWAPFTTTDMECCLRFSGKVFF